MVKTIVGRQYVCMGLPNRSGTGLGLEILGKQDKIPILKNTVQHKRLQFLPHSSVWKCHSSRAITTKGSGYRKRRKKEEDSKDCGICLPNEGNEPFLLFSKLEYQLLRYNTGRGRERKRGREEGEKEKMKGGDRREGKT